MNSPENIGKVFFLNNTTPLKLIEYAFLNFKLYNMESLFIIDSVA